MQVLRKYPWPPSIGGRSACDTAVLWRAGYWIIGDRLASQGAVLEGAVSNPLDGYEVPWRALAVKSDAMRLEEAIN